MVWLPGRPFSRGAFRFLSQATQNTQAKTVRALTSSTTATAARQTLKTTDPFRMRRTVSPSTSTTSISLSWIVTSIKSLPCVSSLCRMDTFFDTS